MEKDRLRDAEMEKYVYEVKEKGKKEREGKKRKASDFFTEKLFESEEMSRKTEEEEERRELFRMSYMKLTSRFEKKPNIRITPEEWNAVEKIYSSALDHFLAVKRSAEALPNENQREYDLLIRYSHSFLEEKKIFILKLIDDFQK